MVPRPKLMHNCSPKFHPSRIIPPRFSPFKLQSTGVICFLTEKNWLRIISSCTAREVHRFELCAFSRCIPKWRESFCSTARAHSIYHERLAWESWGGSKMWGWEWRSDDRAVTMSILRCDYTQRVVKKLNVRYLISCYWRKFLHRPFCQLRRVQGKYHIIRWRLGI